MNRSIVCWLCGMLSIYLATIHVAADAANLLVGDRATSRILSFDASSGAFLDVLVDNDVDLANPASMTLGFDGDLFVASQGGGAVLRYDATTGDPKGNTPDSSVFIPSLPGPAGLLYHNDRLFVSMFGPGFPPTSSLVKVYDSTGGEVGEINVGPANGRTGLAVDSVGDIYVSNFDFFTGQAQVMKFSGADFSPMASAIVGSGNHPFLPGFNPLAPIIDGMNGLVFDSSGNLYAASSFGQQVVKRDTNGVVTTFSSQPAAYPASLLIDGDGNLLFSTLGNDNPQDPFYGQNFFDGNIQKYDLNGNFLGVFIAQGDATNDLLGFQPTSILLVPEPATCLLAICGAVAIGLGLRRKKKT